MTSSSGTGSGERCVGTSPRGRAPWAATGSGCGGQGEARRGDRPWMAGLGTSYGDHHERHNSHGDQPWGQLWAPAVGPSMNVTPAMGPSTDVTSAMGTKHRDKLWTWGSAQGLALGTRQGDRAWGTHSGAIRGVWPWAGGWGWGRNTIPQCPPPASLGDPSRVGAVSTVTGSPPCHPGPPGAWGSVLPELSPFPVLPTRPLQGFALLVLCSLLLSPNSLFLPSASTAALGLRLGFLPLPSSPRHSSPFGCQM